MNNNAAQPHHPGALKRIVFAAVLLIGTLQALYLLDCQPTLLLSLPLPKAYDELSMNLLRGSVEVGDTIRFEALLRNDKKYMYFGPFPAILRIVPNLLFPELFGRWSTLSFLLASILFLLYYTRLIIFCVLLPGDDESPDHSHPSPSHLRITTALLCLLAFGLGPQLFLLNNRSIYAEAMSWGLATYMGSLFYAFHMITLNRFPLTSLVLLGALSGASLLSRLSFGLSTILLCGVVLLFMLRRIDKKNASEVNLQRPSLKGAALCIPVVLCLGIQLWYNYARFGTPFSFGSFEPDSYALSKALPHHFKGATTYGLFHIERIPRALYYYFWPFGSTLSDAFPFFVPRNVRWDPRYFNLTAKVIPLTLCLAFIVFGAICGFLRACRKRGQRTALALAVAGVPQSILLLSFMTIYQRYQFDFLPLLFPLFFCWLAHTPALDRKMSALVVGFILSICLSLAVNLTVLIPWRCNGCAVDEHTTCVRILAPLFNEKYDTMD